MTHDQESVSLDSQMVHTLKNQLAIITSYVDLLIARTPDDSRWLEDLDEIRQAAATALSLLAEPSRG